MSYNPNWGVSSGGILLAASAQGVAAPQVNGAPAQADVTLFSILAARNVIGSKWRIRAGGTLTTAGGTSGVIGLNLNFLPSAGAQNGIGGGAPTYAINTGQTVHWAIESIVSRLAGSILAFSSHHSIDNAANAAHANSGSPGPAATGVAADFQLSPYIASRVGAMTLDCTCVFATLENLA